MKTKSLSVLLILGAILMAPVVSANQTLFYDNFTTLSSNWSTMQAMAGGTLPSLIVNSPSSISIFATRTGGTATYTGAIIANATDPIISGLTPNGTLINMIFNIRPFNITFTHIGTTSISTTLWFGLAPNLNCGTCIPTTPSTYWMGFVVDGTANFLPSSSNGWTTLAQPFGINGVNSINAVRYDSPSALIDVTTQHVFDMAIWINRTNTNDPAWAAFSIDGMSYLNVTQAGCSCLIKNGVLTNLYPFIMINDFWSSAPPWSIGTDISYVLATDYIPSTPSIGFFPSPSAPTKVQQPNIGFGFGGTGDLTAFIQSEAASIGGGNIYFGGTFLTLISLVSLCLVTVKFTRNIFVLTATTLFVLGFATLVGILPIWIIIVDIVLGAAVAFGLISGRFGGAGEAVPENDY